MKHQRRQNLLVERDLQIRFLLIVLLAAASSVFLSIGITAWTMSQLASGLPHDGAFVLSRLPAALGWNALLSLGLTVPWLLFLTLAGTHRIFGPLVRFRHFLRGVAAGEHPEPCRIRDGDHLQDVCELLNAATEPLRRAQREATRPAGAARKAA